MQKALIGLAWNKSKEKFQPVVGFEFSDSPGYFQFYALDCLDHFRKFPDPHDELAEIPFKIAREVKVSLPR